MADYLDEKKHAKHIEKNKLALFGYTFRDITYSQVDMNKVHEVKPKVMRTCLGVDCNKKFLSHGINNRLCESCNEITKKHFD